MRIRSLGQDDPLEEGTATHYIIFAWRIPWIEEPGRPYTIRLQRVGHDWNHLGRSTHTSMFPTTRNCFIQHINSTPIGKYWTSLEKVKVLLTQVCPLFATLWTVAHQAPLSMEFSRQEYWSGLPFPSPEYLPKPVTEPRSPALQADSLPSEPPNKKYILFPNILAIPQTIPCQKHSLILLKCSCLKNSIVFALASLTGTSIFWGQRLFQGIFIGNQLVFAECPNPVQRTAGKLKTRSYHQEGKKPKLMT